MRVSDSDRTDCETALDVTDNGRDGVIIGVSSFEQLASNLRDIEKPRLPEEPLKTLDETWLIARRQPLITGVVT
jgi:hypothetical protein